MKRLPLFLLLWATWGFSLGTLTLLGPLRWTVNWSRSQHWTDSQENTRVYILIGLLVIISFFAAGATVSNLRKQQNARLRFTWLMIPLLGAGFSLYAFMHPKWINSGEETTVVKRFTIGSYPDEAKLDALQKQHYTTIISLLHPAVVPFEPKLMEDEKAAAEKLGLKIHFLSLLPWVGDNSTALDSLRNVVRTATGKVYVHCYLGRDRVNIARRIIEQESGHAAMEGQTFPFRSLDSVKQLERGPVYRLEPAVYFTPFPTKEEYTGYVLAANFNQVVSLVDLQEPGAKALMEEEKKTLAQMQIPFAVYNVSAFTSPAQMQQVIDSIRNLPKPQLVHPFSTNAKEAKLFLQLYSSLSRD